MKAFYSKSIERVYIQRAVEEMPAVQRGIPRLRDLGITELYYAGGREEIPREHLTQSTLYLSDVRGEALGHCPASKGQLCCNYHTLDLYMGCSLGCSYCVMQSYLNFSPITIQVNTAPMVESIRRLAEANPGRLLRVGTGEVGDSLLFDPIFELSAELMAGVADLDNVILEFKSKTDCVDQLIGEDGRGLPGADRTVIGFSLNTPALVASEDGYAVNLERRFAAAWKALEAGMSVAFHFDPMIRDPDPGSDGNWQLEYIRLCDTILQLRRRAMDELPVAGALWPVAWVSMGTVRFTPALREKISDRPYLYDEFSRGRDGKFRYLQPLRAGMYRSIRDALSTALKGERPVRLYMCMEGEAMWRHVFGETPAHISELDPVFATLREE